MYDKKCAELAEYWLSDFPAIDNRVSAARIAQRIQDAIEDELECIQNDIEEALEAERDAAIDRKIDEMRERRKGLDQ